MPQGHPSIQSFYQREVNVAEEVSQAEPVRQGDGFTEEELADALDPMKRKWNPEREYEEQGIGQLIPGPRAVTFTGRIVNINTVLGRSQKQPKASGWHYLIAKDDTAAISIKLYFSRKPYPLKLGQPMSFWTVFISDTTKADTTPINSVNVYANLFPGRVTSDHIMIHTTYSTDGICHTPLNNRKGQPFLGLMTLDSYVKGGHDGVAGAKILVCVKSIGAKKRITKKTGCESDIAEVLLFDHTGEVRLAVWNEIIDSVKEWQPGKTILLISSPGYRVGLSGKGTVGITHETMVDVDPDFSDAEWLRKYALGLAKKESLCLEFPDDIWNVETAEYGVNRMLFTLAEVDNWVRSDGHQVFTGFINVIIMEMSLASIHRRNMLLCAECCGVPIYANTLTIPCRNCSKSLTFSLNPRIIGALVDETGCIAQGKLLWSQRAWEQFFGRSLDEITKMTGEEVRLFEQRVLFMRMHLVFGWAERVGRLAILGMMT